MANIILPPSWRIAERHVTPEKTWRNRRAFLQQMGFTGAGLLTAPALVGAAEKLYPAKRNIVFNPPLTLTDERVATTYNNFYEFSTDKERVHKLVDKLVVTPWKVQIDGLVEKPRTIDLDELITQMGLEERVYRFRCVEAWSMIVPWTGFQLSKLIEKVVPKPEAKFLRFETVMRPEQMPGYERLKRQGYPLPYNEGLRLDEAMHQLTMGVTGIYGKPLPKQQGAPFRIIVPWKYGYKSIKSVVRIEFVAKQPATLWETLSPEEYPFESNVEPNRPHPRWSQASERVVDTGERIKTLPYNGYAEQVAKLYKKS